MKSPLQSLDHIAIAVKDTQQALGIFRDQFGLAFLFTVELPDAPIRLTHLALGSGAHLQLVEPLRADHALHSWLERNGSGLHHLCFKVADVRAAGAELATRGIALRDVAPRSGPHGRKAAFLDPSTTGGALVEITSD